MNNVDKFLNFIENLNLLEINNIIEILKNKYNFSMNDNKDDLKNTIVEKEKKLNYSLKLLEIGSNKIAVIKLIKDLNNLGLKEAKDMLETMPVLIKNDLNEANMNELKSKFENLGSKVEII